MNAPLTFLTAGIIFQLTTSIVGAQGSATAAYLELHKKELAATSYADILPLRSKNSVAHDKPLSKDDMKFLFPLFKSTLPKQVTVLSEQVNGTSAILKATTKPGAQNPNITETTTGIIELTMEDGQWKLEREKWDSKVSMK